MDIAGFVTFLSPFLPFLLSLGKKATEKATETAAGKFGETAWKKAEVVWEKLEPHMEAKPEIKAAVEQVAVKPESAARQAVLQEELEGLFKAQPDLLKTIAQILAPDDAGSVARTQIQQTVSGGNVFNIADSQIENIAGSGNIYHQSKQPQQPQHEPDEVSEG
jgi:hypothetical protein